MKLRRQCRQLELFSRHGANGTDAVIGALPHVSPQTWLKQLTADSIRHLIRRKATTLCRNPGLRDLDHRDVEQELWTHLVAKWCRYDPARGTAQAFAATLIRRKAICILRSRFAQCRDSRRSRSLNRSAGVRGKRLVEHADLVPESAHRARLRFQSLSDEDYLDLALDMAALAKELPPLQRQLCALLGRMSIAEAARNVGISRDQAHAEVRVLRDAFESSGLQQYLPKNADTSNGAGVVLPTEGN